jgi:iron complex outermembrane receptor protein
MVCKTSRSLVTTLCALSVLGFTGGPVWAADVSTDNSASGSLEEIVVTAQRRSENLEQTPVSVSAMTGDSMQKLGIVTESDLQSVVPGLLVRETSDSNQIDYVIRGQSVDAFTSSSPAIPTYLNEIQVPLATSSDFYDMQSVQVLKGPQGTLFGRNSTGGAVLLTTAKPTNEFGGDIGISGGNYRDRQVDGAFNVPIVSDKVLARLAGTYQSRDGFQDNVYDHRHVGDVDRYGLRGSLTIKFSDSIQNDLVVDYAHSGGSDLNPVLYSVYTPGTTKSFIPLPVFYSPGLDGAIGFPGAWNAYLAANPRAYPGGLAAYGALQKIEGPYTVDLNSPVIHRAETTNLSNVTTFNVASDTQIKSIAGYSHVATLDAADLDGSPYSAYFIKTPQGEQYKFIDLSEELQLLGKTLDDKLSYVTGIYYFNEKRYFDAQSEILDLAPIIPGTTVTYNSLSRTVSYAGYAQGTYDLAQATGVTGLGVTAGLRYTAERESVQQLPGAALYNLPGLGNYLSKNTDKLSWQVGLQDQINSDVLIYIVSRRSFRSGGFNETAAPLDAPAAQGGASFEPEIATDVEFGLKFRGEIADFPTQLNIAVYNQWVSNIQRSIYALEGGSPAGFTVNIPKAEITGLELDGQISLAKWLKSGLSAAYTDARFTNGNTELFGVATNYGPFADSPRWSGSLFAEATIPINSDLHVAVRGDVFEQSSFYFGSLNATTNPGTEISSYALAGFHVRLEQNNPGWSVSANVKNAFNRVYYTGGLALGSLLGFNNAIPGVPRTVTIDARYRF